MKTTPKSVSSVIMLALFTGSGSVTAQEVNPNGFPSGPHYNLNIHGKKEGYVCTTPQPYVDPITLEMIYPNNIFVPEDGVGIQIQVQSGSARKGGKASTEYPVFQVTDACAFGAGDPAVVQLPPNENGYRVYARALAKPVADWTLYDNTLVSAVDENNDDLVYLGLVGPDKVVTADGIKLPRAKGKPVAQDITRLFEYTGDICHIIMGEAPLTEAAQMDPTKEYRQLCWTDAITDVTAEIGVLDANDSFSVPTPDGNGGFLCTTGTLVYVPVECGTYDGWLFNIAELVESSWLMDNNGGKLLQVRFYPQ